MPTASSFRLAILLVAALLVPFSAFARGDAAATADAELEKWRKGLEYDGREVFRKRHQIVQAMDLKPGTVIADIGAGTGFFTRLFAEKVGPQGKVYATDISRDSVQKLMRLLGPEATRNVVPVVNSDTDVKLPPQSLDVAFMSDAYHHFDRPKEMLASIMQALKPGGRIVLLEFERIPGKSPQWVLDHVKHPKEEIIRQFEEAGFDFMEEKKGLLEFDYFAVFRRPLAAARRPAPSSAGIALQPSADAHLVPAR